MHRLSAARPGIAAVAASLSVACGTASGVATAPADQRSPSAEATSPVPVPRPGILGCVESRELKEYVLALDAQRREARQTALDALGSTAEIRRGALGEAGAVALDQSYEADGQRFAVAAELAPQFEPSVTLAKQGPVLRRIDERARAHAVDVLVCGLERCARPRAGQRVEARPLVIALAPGETWGGALELGYDYWWARVRYNRREACPPLE
ncbi:MAG TPA: hypothetical protein VMG12_23340 [Polyangiaceae bacterium]|nr:hypothetical protein [Polyangiaceae bacterium]